MRNLIAWAIALAFVAGCQGNLTRPGAAAGRAPGQLPPLAPPAIGPSDEAPIIRSPTGAFLITKQPALPTVTYRGSLGAP